MTEAGAPDGHKKWLLAKQLLSGAAAGTLADAITYPMMTVKSRMQVQGAGGAAAPPGAFTYRGPVNALYQICAKEGVKTLYKGYGTVVQIAPAQALYMATYQVAKKNLPGGADNPLVHFSGGVIATLVQSSVMVPLEVLRTRQMVQQSTSHGAYTGSLHAATEIFKHEGIGALYRGFGLAQFVWGPYNAMYLPLWERFKRVSVSITGKESVEKLPIQWEAASAFSAAAIASFLTNPMDVVKTRLQAQGKTNKHAATQYTGAGDAISTIYRQEGLRGFFRGAFSRVLWVSPSGCIMFTTFDQLMKYFTR